MAPKWTATRDQNLLLLIIKDIKVDFNELAKKWKTAFPNEDFNPTAKAVSEHVAALRRKMGTSSPTTAVSATPTSKPKPKPKATNGGIPKTPTSKPKRSRAEMMSNEDDSEAEKGMDFDTPVPKRTTPSRRRTVTKYKEETDTEEDDVVVAAKGKSPDTDKALHTPGDITSPRPSIARSKSNPPKLDYFRESDGPAEEEEDVSDFEPFT